jgi:ech hydrogenase subunit E
MGYAEGIERIMDVEIPDRAKYLRTIWCEMSRLHSHLLWLGLLADAFGFESLFMHCWRMRETILDMFEASTGGRVIFSVNKIGGVLKDMDSSMLRSFVDMFDKMEEEVRQLTNVFMNDYTVASRLKGVGILTKDDAILYGAVGPMMRAAGIEQDTRKLGYAAYGDLDFDIITGKDCDSYARCMVRVEEIFQSFNMRSRRGSLFKMTNQNIYLWDAGILALILSTVVIYVPFLARAFEFEHISVVEYFVALGLAFLIIPLVEIGKAIARALTKK